MEYTALSADQAMQRSDESLWISRSSSRWDSEASFNLFDSIHAVGELTGNLGVPSQVDDNFTGRRRATLASTTAIVPRGTAPTEQIQALGIPSCQATRQNIELLRLLGNEVDSEEQPWGPEYTTGGQPSGKNIIAAFRYSRNDWEARKPDIEALYRKHPLSKIKSEMDKIGFHAS
jgi:hypothetical protein